MAQCENLSDPDFYLSEDNITTVSLGGKSVRAFYSGGRLDKPTVVFLHGFNSFFDMFAPFLNKLMNEYNLLTFDLPGHGRTDYYDKYDLETFLAFIKAMVDHYGLSDYYMTGHSMGALLVLACSENARFSSCRKFVAFSPAGVRLVEDCTTRLLRLRIAGLLAVRFASCAQKIAAAEMESRSFSKMPPEAARNLRRMAREMLQFSNPRENVRRAVYQMQKFPWNGHFERDLSSNRVKIVLARYDPYVDFDSSAAVFRKAEVTDTIHDNVILIPERCFQIFRSFVQESE